MVFSKESTYHLYDLGEHSKKSTLHNFGRFFETMFTHGPGLPDCRSRGVDPLSNVYGAVYSGVGLGQVICLTNTHNRIGTLFGFDNCVRWVGLFVFLLPPPPNHYTHVC